MIRSCDRRHCAPAGEQRSTVPVRARNLDAATPVRTKEEMVRTLSSFARGLLQLQQRRADGMLEVRTTAGRLRLVLKDGHVTAFDDRRRWQPSAEGGGRRETRSESERIYVRRKALVRRCVRVLEGALESCEFGAANAMRALPLEDPVSVHVLLLDIARHMRLPTDATRLLDATIETTERFQAFDRGLFAPHEQAMATLFDADARHLGQTLAGVGGRQGLRTLALWVELGILRTHRAGNRHQRLVMHTRRMRSGELRGLERRERRRVVADAHPDRFEASLQRLSRKVFEAALEQD